MNCGERARLSGFTVFLASIFAGALFLGTIWPSGDARAEGLRFVGFVQFKPFGGIAALAGAQGTLSTAVEGKSFRMRLSNVAIGGAAGDTELVTRVDRDGLGLESSLVGDVVKGQKVREMKRKRGKSDLDGSETDIFEFSEFSSGNVTRTEPYIEYKVADFLSTMLIAADAIDRQDTKPINLSMLSGSSVRKVVVTFAGPKTVGGREGVLVKAIPPDNPAGGISYVIARTDDGQYYPALVSAKLSEGLVELEGVPGAAR